MRSPLSLNMFFTCRGGAGRRPHPGPWLPIVHVLTQSLRAQVPSHFSCNQNKLKMCKWPRIKRSSDTIVPPPPRPSAAM